MAKTKRCFWIMGAVFFLLILLNLLFGAVDVGSLRELFREGMDSTGLRILLYVRLPRTLAAILAGAGLAGAGTVIQAVLHNPLAGPNIIGVNAGAGFFAVLFMAIFPYQLYLLPFGAFVGALFSLLLIYGIARRSNSSTLTLVLSGVAVNALLNAASDLVHRLHPDTVTGSMDFRIGGLSGISPSVLTAAGTLIVLALTAAYILRSELDILQLGDETARSLGMNVRKIRLVLLILAAILAGATVSFTGLLGFVGLIVPHASRFLVGGESKILLPFSALSGASLVLGCDLLARTLFAPYEIPVGILLAFLGAPFFLWLLLKKEALR